jgi:predicted dehydrogenase
MNMWLVGAGYWGSKIKLALANLGVEATIIDVKNGQTIDDINTPAPVMLATPLWQHYDQVLTLLDRGHDVYVEKPMAENAIQVEHIESQLGHDQILMVGHLFVHHPQMAKIKQIITAGTIGQVKHITSRRLNWGIYQTKTTPVLSLAVHDISIILELCGSNCMVYDATSWQLAERSQSDRVYFRGIAGTVSFDVDVSWCWPTRVRETIIIGTQGQIVWNQDSNTIVVTPYIVQDNRASNGPTMPVQYVYPVNTPDPLAHELQHFIHCVQNRIVPTTGVDEALAVARVVDQVHTWIGSSPLTNPT